MATVVEEHAILEEEQQVVSLPPNKLTLEQANKLASGHPFELIDGRIVFKDDEAAGIFQLKNKLTLEQANKVADGRPFELIEGRMVFKMADYDHSQTQMLLGDKLLDYFIANPIGRVLPQLTHRLWPENPYQGRLPDLSVILNEHFQETERYPTRAPDIAIEIISEDDVWTKLFSKAKLYFAKGSREVWLVDPYEKNMMVLTPTSRRWVLDTLTSELLPGFQVDLKDIFTWPATTK
ncbi:Uma2 family endonuclease [candidate division KSB1 bacterium]|nr:Uma2 family endonuclease [candidate division KSB1 bacterium]